MHVLVNSLTFCFNCGRETQTLALSPPGRLLSDKFLSSTTCSDGAMFVADSGELASACSMLLLDTERRILFEYYEHFPKTALVPPSVDDVEMMIVERKESCFAD